MKSKIKKILTYAVLILTLLVSVMPLIWMWQAALVPSNKLNVDPFAFPTSLTLDNIKRAWTTGKMNVYMINSILVAVPRVMGVLLLSSLAGYAFGKLKFKGRDKIFSFMMFGMMIPIQAMVIPLYYNLQQMGLINTRLAMVIPYFGLSMPFAVFNQQNIFFSRACSDPNREYPRWSFERICRESWALMASGKIHCENVVFPVVDFEECDSAYIRYIMEYPQESIKMGVKF